MHFVEDGFPAHPQCYRSVCCKCGSARTGEKVLNTGIEADVAENGFYSTLYLCASCVCEMGREFGQLDEQKSSELRATNEALHVAISVLESRLDTFERLDAMVRDYAYPKPLTFPAAEPEVPADVPVLVKPGTRRQK